MRSPSVSGSQCFAGSRGRGIEALVGEAWIADTSKDGHRWVVRAPTPDQAFAELREQCEGVLQVE